LIDPGAWDAFAVFLEQRGSVEYLIQRLEDLDVERKSSSEDAKDPGGTGSSAKSAGDEVSSDHPSD
jgi:hypothetical protein